MRLISAVLFLTAVAGVSQAQAGSIGLITSPGSNTVVPNFADFGTPEGSLSSVNVANGTTADGMTISDGGSGFALGLQQVAWGGDFGPFEPAVLYDLGNGPVTIAFATSIYSFGVQFDPDYPPNGFDAQIQAYNSAGSLLGTFSESGTFAGPNYSTDTALFIGVQSGAGNIAKVVISGLTGSDNDFALSGGNLSTPVSAPSPEPDAVVLLGTGLIAAFLALRPRPMGTVR